MHDPEVAQHVPEVVDPRRRRPEGQFHIGDGRQRVVLDRDQVRRAARGFRVDRRQDRHRFARVPDALRCEHGLIGELQPKRRLPGQVGSEDDRVHARAGQGLRDIHRADPGVRMGAA